MYIEYMNQGQRMTTMFCYENQNDYITFQVDLEKIIHEVKEKQDTQKQGAQKPIHYMSLPVKYK